jgi:hypothetical protein
MPRARIALPQSSRSSAVEARRVAVPADARTLSTLTRIDYEDAFVIEAGGARERTSEQWARAVLEDASTALRLAARVAWLAIALRLGSSPTDQYVLGWRVRRRTPEFTLLGASSPFGLEGELLFRPQEQSLLYATFVQQKNVVMRAVWTLVEPGHRQFVRQLLEQTSRRQRRDH